MKRDTALVDSGVSGGSGGGKRSTQHQVNYTVIVGLAEDEASEAMLSEAEIAEGMGPATKDKYFRTLVRNTCLFQLNSRCCTKSVVSFGQIMQVPTLKLLFRSATRTTIT